MVNGLMSKLTTPRGIKMNSIDYVHRLCKNYPFVYYTVGSVFNFILSTLHK